MPQFFLALTLTARKKAHSPRCELRTASSHLGGPKRRRDGSSRPVLIGAVFNVSSMSCERRAETGDGSDAVLRARTIEVLGQC